VLTWIKLWRMVRCDFFFRNTYPVNRQLIFVIPGKQGVYTFRVHGSMHHRIGSALPEPGQSPKFLQLYIYDTDHELQNRMNATPAELNPEIMARLQEMVHSRNPYVQQFKQLARNQERPQDFKL
jgi:hypothetical protein